MNGKTTYFTNMRIDNNTYIFSDPHYNHTNLVRGCSSWEHGENCRDFDTLEEHNDTIVKNINKVVPENATLICLGDWSFGGIGSIWEFRKRINCKDIHLIIGNHDHHIENNGSGGVSLHVPKEDEKLYKEISGITQPFPENGTDIFPQTLFSSVSHYKEIQFKRDGHRYHIVLSHYAMRVWNKMHRGSVMLYGHSHGTLDEFRPDIANPTWVGDDYFVRNYRTMDVGLDTNGLRPYWIEDIIDMMKDRPVGFEVDHHRPEKDDTIQMGQIDRKKYDNREPQ